MKAVIMAGGEGSRLRPLTSNQQKAMLPLANRPMMEHIVRLLKDHGFDELVVTVAFLANTVRTYFGDGSDFGIRMVYATEETPLGTAGSVRNAMDELDERFLVIAGDVITDIDLGEIVRFHEERGALATIGLQAREDPLEFGIVITREDGTIERFLEKPTWGQVFSDTINTGIYVLEPEIFDYIEADRPVDFSNEVFPALLADDRPLYGYVMEGYWEDVGTTDAYVRAHRDVLDGTVALELPGTEVQPGVWVGEGTEISERARLDAPCIVGDHCRVDAGAHVGAYTVLGASVRLGADAFVERSVVHDNAYIGPGANARGCVVGRSTDLRRGARCEEGVVLGDECLIGDHALVNPGVKIYPFKTVEPGAIVNSSIVWESRGARHLFGRSGVAGLANVDITPELAVKVAMAYGTTLKKGSTVVTSRDSSRAGRTLKRAVMAGLNAAGVDVEDLEAATIPVTRFHVRSARSQGGISVRLVPGDAQSVALRFFDADGIDLDVDAERKIERLFHREDFRRSFSDELGDISFPGRALEHYTAALMATVDEAAVANARFKLVLDYAYGTTSFVMPNVLAKLGAEVLALNPFAATAGAAAFDRAVAAGNVADLVRVTGAHLGAVIHPDGEHLTLVDDTGHTLSDDEALLAMLALVCTVVEKPRVVLPVVASRVAETICTDASGEVVWTKIAGSEVMRAAAAGRVTFAGGRDGGFIFPAFVPACDATASLVNLLALLAQAGAPLSKVVGGLPPVHLAHETVVTPWDRKDAVVPTLVDRTRERELVLVDGVKVIHDDSWALVLPDEDQPVVHVWAEGRTDAAARALAEEYARRVAQLLS